MYNDPSSIKEAIAKLNSVSPSFCLAKWKHATVHLHMGRTHSCYLPPTHKIPVSEVKNNPKALHNTSFKKKQRKMMLEGERPTECSICWQIEDLKEQRYSDRHYRGQDCWTKPFFEETASSTGDEDVSPSYLEVSFSSKCNFKCSYCNPTFSSAWLGEVKKHGGYPLTGKFSYLSPFWLRAKGLMPLEDEKNPYVKAFWQWWPELKHDLMFFRLTGGEPLLVRETFKVLEEIERDPLPKLELSINSNLGVPAPAFNKLIDSVKSLQENKKIRHFMMHTSLDSYGRHAEYIRHGLDFSMFESYVERYLTELPHSSLSFTCTYNILSIVGFRKFVEWILSLRKRFSNEHRNIFIDIPHLQGPEHQSCLILTPELEEIIQSDIEFMKSRESQKYGVKPAETLKLKRILDWVKENKAKDKKQEKQLKRKRVDFIKFFEEHDKRRGTNLYKTFPEMSGFFKECLRLL